MNFCDACETCSHCLKHGCIPITDEGPQIPAPLVYPVIDEGLLPPIDPSPARAFCQFYPGKTE